jgi:hypothetical protein
MLGRLPLSEAASACDIQNRQIENKISTQRMDDHPQKVPVNAPV